MFLLSVLLINSCINCLYTNTLKTIEGEIIDYIENYNKRNYAVRLLLVLILSRALILGIPLNRKLYVCTQESLVYYKILLNSFLHM